MLPQYWKLFEELANLPRHINSPGFDFSIEELSEVYDLKVLTYKSDDVHNGWVIPPKYMVKEAFIKLDGKEIYNGLTHPLSVISYSAPFAGFVSKSQLMKHIHFDSRNPEWIPYHFRQSYRPWQRDWGFCMTERMVENLSEGQYEVLIEIEEGRSELRIAMGSIEGKSDITIALCAHLDHPGMANDGLSGVMVACEILNRFKGRNLEYGLEVLIVPEIIGSEIHLNNRKGPPLFEGLFIESVGRRGAIVLQSSLTKSFVVEDRLEEIIKTVDPFSRTLSYKEIFGNDEGCFEAYGCPMPVIHRGEFEGYHSSGDDFASLESKLVEETIDVVAKLIEDLQNEIIIRKKYRGVIAAANPSYGIYIDPGQPAFGISISSPELRRVMEIMALPKKVVSLREICLSANSNLSETYNYLKTWEAAGLIEIFGLRSFE